MHRHHPVEVNLIYTLLRSCTSPQRLQRWYGQDQLQALPRKGYKAYFWVWLQNSMDNNGRDSVEAGPAAITFGNHTAERKRGCWDVWHPNRRRYWTVDMGNEEDCCTIKRKGGWVWVHSILILIRTDECQIDRTNKHPELYTVLEEYDNASFHFRIFCCQPLLQLNPGSAWRHWRCRQNASSKIWGFAHSNMDMDLIWPEAKV